MKQIVYTRHAEEAIALRRLKKTQVAHCIEHPDEILPAREGKNLYVKDFGKNYLKVVVADEEMRMVVITAHWVAKKRHIR